MAVKIKTIPPWVLILLGAIAVLLFLKFCFKNESIPPPNLDAIKKQHNLDSIEFEETKKKWQSERNDLTAQVQELNIKNESTTNHLNKILSDNKRLIDKFYSKPIPGKDSSGQTIVPNEFIDDCKDCFTQIAATSDTVEKYKSEAEGLRVLYVSAASIDSARIAELEKEKLKLNKDYNDIRIAAEVNAKYLEPRRKLKVGIAGMLNNKFLPNGIGPSFMYQDKKDRNIGYRPLFGNGEPMHIIDILVPFKWSK
jgi:hypothetical protein